MSIFFNYGIELSGEKSIYFLEKLVSNDTRSDDHTINFSHNLSSHPIEIMNNSEVDTGLCSEDILNSDRTHLWRKIFLVQGSFSLLLNILNLIVVLNFKHKTNFHSILIVMAIHDILLSTLSIFLSIKEIQMFLIGKTQLVVVTHYTFLTLLIGSYVFLWLSIYDRYNAFCRCFRYPNLFVTLHWRKLIALIDILMLGGNILLGYVAQVKFCLNGVTVPHGVRKNNGEKHQLIVYSIWLAVTVGLCSSAIYFLYRISKEMKRIRLTSKRLRIQSSDRITYQITRAVKRIIISSIVTVTPILAILIARIVHPTENMYHYQYTAFLILMCGPLTNTIAFVCNNGAYKTVILRLCCKEVKSGASVSVI